MSMMIVNKNTMYIHIYIKRVLSKYLFKWDVTSNILYMLYVQNYMENY